MEESKGYEKNMFEIGQFATMSDDITPPDSEKLMSKGRILKNLLVVCFGFLFLFSAYQALANLQSTLNIEDNLGVVSQSVIYAALIVSSLFLPKLVIKKLGCKMTLLLSILTYAPYVAANFYPRMSTFVPTAIFLGLGAAPLWSAKCTYINEISSMYSRYDSDSVDVVTSKFFGIFFMIFQNTQILGNLVSFFVLKPPDSKNSTVETNHFFSHSQMWQAAGVPTNESCGLRFENEINDKLEPPPEDKRYMLIGIYLGCVILASIIVAVFLDPLKRQESKDDKGVFSRVIATLKHLKKPQQLLLIPLTIFSGIEQAFILGDYTKAYVACVWGLHSVGLVFICFGVVNAIMSFFAGRILKYVPRKVLMLIGTAGNIGVCIALYMWNPKENEFLYAFIIVGVWGLSDAIWQTQINGVRCLCLGLSSNRNSFSVPWFNQRPDRIGIGTLSSDPGQSHPLHSGRTRASHDVFGAASLETRFRTYRRFLSHSGRSRHRKWGMDVSNCCSLRSAVPRK